MEEIIQGIIGWIIIIWIIVIIVKKKRKKQNNNNFNENAFMENEVKREEKRIDPEVLKLGMEILSGQTNYSSLYEKKDYLMTTKEYKFYKLLKPICNRYNLNIFSQVSLYEIVKPKTRDYNALNKIKSKSIDFVITDTNCKIKLCIELDDPTHIRQDRQERDKFIKELFEQLDIKFLQIPVQDYYNMQQIEEKIKESL